ncbi:MAG: hypothetical protein GY810_00005, partial [Aureispira sp.]|nr:hypothetical protein [Aureispira sp.]
TDIMNVYIGMRVFIIVILGLILNVSIGNAQYFSVSLREGVNIPMQKFKNENAYSFPSLGVNVTMGADYMFSQFLGLGINTGYVYFYNNQEEATEQLASITTSSGSRSAGSVSGGDYHLFKYTFSPLIGYTWEELGIGLKLMPEIGGLTLLSQKKDIEQHSQKRVQEIEGNTGLVYGLGAEVRYYIKSSYGIGFSLAWWQTQAFERKGEEILYDDSIVIRRRDLLHTEIITSFEGNIVLFYRF